MPFTVSCQCGQSFRAQDNLAGKTVACPACGGALQISNPSAPAVTASAEETIRVTCSCGHSLKAPARMAGKQARCPHCKNPLTIPAPKSPLAAGIDEGWDDPLFSAPVSPQPVASRPRPKTVAKRSSSAGKQQLLIAAMAIGGVVVLMLVIVISWSLSNAMGSNSTASSRPTRRAMKADTGQWNPTRSDAVGVAFETPHTMTEQPTLNLPTGKFSIWQNLVPAPPMTIVVVLETSAPKDREKEIMDRILSGTNQQFKVLGQKNVTWVGQSAKEVSLEAHAQGKKAHGRVRILITGTALYFGAFFWDDENGVDADADRFFNSFQILPKSA